LDVYHAPELHPEHLGISIGSLYYLAWIVALRGDYFGSIRRRPKWIGEVFAKIFCRFLSAEFWRAANVLSRSRRHDYPGNEREIRLQSFAAGPALNSSTAFPRDQKGAKA